MANANVDAEKLVFAVDIICFFMKKHYPREEFQLGTHIDNVIDYYRPHVRQHFSESLKKIIGDIDDTQGFIVQRDFSEMKRTKGEVNLSSLMEYIDSFKNSNLDERFSAGNFLLFCARVSLMGCFFFVSGRKSDLSYVIDIIKDSFPSDEDECRLLWDEIDNAAENYGSNSQRNSASAIFGREPSQHVGATSHETEGSSKSNAQINTTAPLFGREARESAGAISSGAESSSRNIKQENVVFDKERREIADVISSGTEDSCSSSSTTNTESDGSANTQSMGSASSVESLNKLIMELNRMAKPTCENAAPAVATSSIAAAAPSNTVAAAAPAPSNKGCIKFVKNKQSTSTAAAAASSAESVKYFESQPSGTAAAASSTETKYFESQPSGTAAAASSTETIKHIESRESATEAVPAENLESNIQNPSVSSSTSNRCPKIEIDFKARIEKAFMEVEAESSQKSPAKSPAKSPLKSCLGKRPSPRKEKVSFSKDAGSDDSETEIKKPKLRSPESKD